MLYTCFHCTCLLNRAVCRLSMGNAPPPGSSVRLQQVTLPAASALTPSHCPAPPPCRSFADTPGNGDKCEVLHAPDQQCGKRPGVGQAWWGEGSGGLHVMHQEPFCEVLFSGCAAMPRCSACLHANRLSRAEPQFPSLHMPPRALQAAAAASAGSLMHAGRMRPGWATAAQTATAASQTPPTPSTGLVRPMWRTSPVSP